MATAIDRPALLIIAYFTKEINGLKENFPRIFIIFFRLND